VLLRANPFDHLPDIDLRCTFRLGAAPVMLEDVVGEFPEVGRSIVVGTDRCRASSHLRLATLRKSLLRFDQQPLCLQFCRELAPKSFTLVVDNRLERLTSLLNGHSALSYCPVGETGSRT